MFETLSEKLTGIFRRLGDKGVLTEQDVDAALREVRIALLEADVNFRVVRSFISRIKERALDQELLKSLSPGQQVVKIANEELTEVLGGAVKALEPASPAPSVMLMVGLNGSGKTTTSAKIAAHLKQSGESTTLVAADLQRPAAILQLETLGKQIGVPVHSEDPQGSSPEAVARAGVDRGADLGASWVIVDTAGRFQVDDDLMSELQRVSEAVSPSETLLVVDAMTGQEAVEVAEEFHSRIGLTGLVLTKMDGDARGGAALSITSVTGVPIKFIGTGERTDALEPYIPERLASRILGMGDVLTLIEKAQSTFDQEEAVETVKRIRKADFNLEDFLKQLQQLQQMGPLSNVLDMIPGMGGNLKGKLRATEVDESQFKRMEAIIQSMTPEERGRPAIIGGSRRRRIARGSGTSAHDVNQLLNQFREAQKMMRAFATGKGPRNLMRLLR